MYLILQVAASLGFFLPTTLVHDNPDLQVVEDEMFQLHIVIVVASGFVLFLIMICTYDSIFDSLRNSN